MSKPVKITYYDLVNMTNTIKAGCYKVEVYEISEQWLFMARPTINHPHIAYIKSFLIPSLGLQIMRWRLHDASKPSDYSFYDYYVDVGVIETHQHEWRLRDFYLDILVVEGKAAYVLDTDEYLQGIQDGFLTTEEAAFALETTHSLINGLAENGYNLGAWLKQKGINIDLDKLK
jgi:uncharacterized protein